MDIEDKRCKVCKKTFSVLHPTRWAYKQWDGNHVKAWYCSWKCLRADESKHAKKPRKERHNKIIEGVDELANIKHRDPAEVCRGMFAAMDGGEEPRAYLRKIGYKNPTDQLSHLRCWASKNDRAALARLNKIPRMVGSGRKKAKASAKKVPKAGESLLHYEHTGEPLGKVEETDESDGGVTVRIKTVKKVSDLPVPKPLDGGEWTNAKLLTKDEHAEAHTGGHAVVIKEARLPDLPKRLKIAGLESDAIKKASWVRTGDEIVLHKDEEMSLILTPQQWRGMAKEIELMLEQFGV